MAPKKRQGMTTNLDKIITSYKMFLGDQNSNFIKKFEATEKTNVDGAKFEAVCYWMLRSRGLIVEIGDAGNVGGADFICSSANCKFVVEATTINTWAMERKTGMKHDQVAVEGGFYEVFPTLYEKLIEKVKQVEKYDFPRMIAIGSFHNESSVLFRHVMADEYLAVFFNHDNLCRPILTDTLKDISAFALMAVGNDGYSVIGFLNPIPYHCFKIQSLPDIWFRQITSRGLTDGTLMGEWISTSARDRQSFEYTFDTIL